MINTAENKSKLFQVELWENCSHNCSFCYLNKDRHISSKAQMLENISKTVDLVKNLSEEYRIVGLIGGEFFDTKLCDDSIISELNALILLLDEMVQSHKLDGVFITASLMYSSLDCFFQGMRGVKNKENFLICTSYDTTGRFKNTSEKNLWFENVCRLVNSGYNIHTEIVLTDDFINDELSNRVLQKLLERTSVDLKCPSTYRKSMLSNECCRTVEWYRKMVRQDMKTMPSGFYISSRNNFIKFLYYLKKSNNLNLIKKFCSNCVRSDVWHLLPLNKVISDRCLGDTENAPCGHPWDSYCYLDSDKCSRCDAEEVLYE